MKLPAAIVHDTFLGPLVKRFGAPDIFSSPKSRGVFQALVRSIVYQQLSGKAAATIHGRFRNLFPRKNITPERVLALAEAELRAVGLSRAKAEYVRNLAQKFFDGSIPYRRFPKLASDRIIDHLVSVKGIGEWTVHMFLIFTLQRLDILPTGDLGIRKGFQKLYKLKSLPSPAEMQKLATPWRAYASIAAWYLWRLADEGK